MLRIIGKDFLKLQVRDVLPESGAEHRHWYWERPDQRSQMTENAAACDVSPAAPTSPAAATSKRSALSDPASCKTLSCLLIPFQQRPSSRAFRLLQSSKGQLQRLFF